MDIDTLDAQLVSERENVLDDGFLSFCRDAMNTITINPERFTSACLVTHYLTKVMDIFIADAPETRVMKEQFSSGKVDARVDSDIRTAASSVANSAIGLMKESSQQILDPGNAALSVALFSYGAFVCSPSLLPFSFRELFTMSWLILYSIA